MALPSAGRISRQLGALAASGRDATRQPHPDLVEVLDPRTVALLAADLPQTIGPTSMLIAETLAAAIHHHSPVFFGDPQNATGAIGDHARVLGVELIVVGSAWPSVAPFCTRTRSAYRSGRKRPV